MKYCKIAIKTVSLKFKSTKKIEVVSGNKSGFI